MDIRWHAAAAAVVALAVLALRHAELTADDMSCPHFLSRADAGRDTSRYARWLAGYLEGMAERDGGAGPALDALPQDAAAWLRTYCETHRESTLAEAAAAFASARGAMAGGRAR